MATTKPTFQNATSRTLAAPRYNFSDVPVPPGKYVTGAFYAEENTLDGNPTGTYLYEVLGLTDVSSGSDPLPADIVYDYVASGYGPLKAASLNLTSLDVYANNAAALAGGLVVGDLYRTGADPDVVSIVH
jgi:hypothetical protein